MTEFMSFQEMMKVVKEGDELISRSGGLLKYSSSVLRWKGSTNSKESVTYPWLMKFKIIKPKPVLVDWYRPRVVWSVHDSSPKTSDMREFHKDMKTTNWGLYSEEILVLEWETIQAPESWEGCDGDT